MTHPTSLFLRLTLALLLSLATAACGGSGGGLSVGIGSDADLYVDVNVGDDTNDGSAGAPFKTITFALSQAANGDTVNVAPGFYDVVSGETFPIVVPAGVRLLGDQPNKGKGPIPTAIIGGGLIPASIEPGTNAVLLPEFDSAIGGFWIQNTNPVATWRRTGVVIAHASIRLRNSTIENNPDSGVRFLPGASYGHVHDNRVRDNDAGLTFMGGGATVEIDDNIVSNNRIGVIVNASNIDLGGGIAGSPGNNLLAFNTGADLAILGGVNVSAQHNTWNHVPPTVHVGDAQAKPDGVDIWVLDGNTVVNTTGAKLPVINIPWVPVGPITP